jgi:hypothetical protein
MRLAKDGSLTMMRQIKNLIEGARAPGGERRHG